MDDSRWLIAASQVLEPERNWEVGGPFANGISDGTWGRFRTGRQPIKERAFKAYCQILGLPWKEIVVRTPTSGAIQHLVDWGDVPDISYFYGRTAELCALEQSIVCDRSRLVALLGVGGIGKTALAVKLVQRVEEEFEYLVWQSLHPTLSLPNLITELLQCLPQQDSPVRQTEPIAQLMKCLHSARCLLVLDAAESVLQEGSLAGCYREGYEGYGELLRRIGLERHQSCLILISQEPPREISLLEQQTCCVRSHFLKGLLEEAAREILRANGLSEEPSWDDLSQRYGYNPFYLKIVSATVRELFGGSVTQFLRENTIVLGDIRPILDQQFRRLSELEQEVMHRLALAGQPLALSQLQAQIVLPIAKSELIETLFSLKRRSLIETSSNDGKRLFNLQPVMRKYVISAFSKSVPASSPISSQISSPSAQDFDSKLEEHLSCGEKILLSGFSPGRSNKQKGVEAIASKDYEKAVDWLEQAWNKERDPETLIYLNNAWINVQKTSKAPIYTIAVVAPLNSTPDGTSNTGKDILRGVAQAQDQAIKQDFNLKVLIADDANNKEQAQQIAKTLVNKPEILGVIGHYASDITIPIVPIYQQHQLVLISPSSSSSQLSSEGDRPDRVFFRTAPTTQLMARSLVNYLIKQAGRHTVAIFYNHQSQFGRSIREQFAVNFLASDGKVVEDSSREELSLGSSNFNPKLALTYARQQRATVLAIFPDGNTNPYTFQNGLDLIEESQGCFWILGVSSLHAANTLQQVGNSALNRFVLHVHWHPLSSTNEFPTEARTYWKEDVDWKTATSYDATWALIEALKKQSKPSRTGVQKVLADPNFQAIGATGTISFNGSDRKEPIDVLLKVVRSNCNDSGYTFVPINHPVAKTDRLDCPSNSIIPTIR